MDGCVTGEPPPQVVWKKDRVLLDSSFTLLPNRQEIKISLLQQLQNSLFQYTYTVLANATYSLKGLYCVCKIFVIWIFHKRIHVVP